MQVSEQSALEDDVQELPCLDKSLVLDDVGMLRVVRNEEIAMTREDHSRSSCATSRSRTARALDVDFRRPGDAP